VAGAGDNSGYSDRLTATLINQFQRAISQVVNFVVILIEGMAADVYASDLLFLLEGMNEGPGRTIREVWLRDENLIGIAK